MIDIVGTDKKKAENKSSSGNVVFMTEPEQTINAEYYSPRVDAKATGSSNRNGKELYPHTGNIYHEDRNDKNAKHMR